MIEKIEDHEFLFQILLIVASETGNVYTYSTENFEPILTSQPGRNLIRTCLRTEQESQSMPQNKEKEAEITQSEVDQNQLNANDESGANLNYDRFINNQLLIHG